MHGTVMPSHGPPEQKVVNGRGDGTFDPAGFITREELVTMIWRYAGEAASEQDLSSWPDAGKVYDYATGAMKWAVETGVINGKDGKLRPEGQRHPRPVRRHHRALPEAP